MKYSRISGYNFCQFQLDNALYCKIRLLIVVHKIITRFKKAMLGKLLTVQKKFSTCSSPMPKCNDLPKYFIQTLIYSFKRAIITCQEIFKTEITTGAKSLISGYDKVILNVCKIKNQKNYSLKEELNECTIKECTIQCMKRACKNGLSFRSSHLEVFWKLLGAYAVGKLLFLPAR